MTQPLRSKLQVTVAMDPKRTEGETTFSRTKARRETTFMSTEPTAIFITTYKKRVPF